MNQMVTTQKRSLVDSMAAKYEMEPAAFMGAVKATCIKGECSNEQFAAFLMVAKEYDLNPLTKEIYAFPDRGGITPIVSIDGWMNLINSHPQFDGMEFVDNMGDDGKLHSVECKMYRKDRQRPTTVIEYMSECFRQTDPWKKWPNRMLRHKAAIQCARYAFGFSGIMEPDEYERMKDVTPAAQPNVMDRLKQAKEATTLDAQPVEGFSRDFVHAETESASAGFNDDFSDDEPTLDLSPQDDAARLPASTEGTGGEDLPASTSSVPSTLTNHLMDFARKGFKTLSDEIDDDAKTTALDMMVGGYQALIDTGEISPDDWPKFESIVKVFCAVFTGKKTVEEGRQVVATDFIGCKVSAIGGVA